MVGATRRVDNFSGSTLRDRQDYLARRNSVVDRLLPEGAGGTLFVEDLDEKLGIAIAATGTIVISQAALPDAEDTEIHERAHLLHANAPSEVARVMRALPPPTQSYASKSDTEHFAEMAASAWRIIVPNENGCLVQTRAELLREEEKAVPGTAAFVTRFLSDSAMAGRDSMLDVYIEAERLTAPLRDEWSAVWSHVDAQRTAQGTLRSWGRPCVAQIIGGQRAFLGGGNAFDKFAAALMLPAHLISMPFCGR